MNLSEINYKHLYIILISLFFSYVAFLFTTNFTNNLFFQSRYYSAYMDMWNHLANGSVEISNGVMDGERYLKDGKTLTYYLPFPALIRKILSFFYLGKSAVLSFVLAVFLFSVAVSYFFKKIIDLTKFPNSSSFFYLFLPLLISPILSIFFEASIAWESLMWAVALFSLDVYFLFEYLTSKEAKYKNFFLIVSTFILFTRPTFIIPTIILCIYFLVKDFWLREFRRSLFFYLFFLIGLSILFLLNYLKWGSPFEFAPMIYHEQLINTPRGEAMANMPSISFARIPSSINYYLIPFTNFFDMKIDTPLFDYIERKRTVTAAYPFLLFFSFVSLTSLFLKNIPSPFFNKKDFILLLLFTFMPICLCLTVHSMALRYRVDFFPFLYVFGGLGLIRFLKFTSKIKIIFIAFILNVSSILLSLDNIISERNDFYGSCYSISNPSLCKFFDKFHKR